MEPLKHLCPYIRLAIDQTLYLPWRLPERIIFDYELVYIKKGRVSITIAERRYEGCEGDIFFFRPGIPHSMTILSEEGLRQPHIHFDLIHRPDSEQVKISFRNRDEMSKEELLQIRQDITIDSPMTLPDVIRLRDKRVFEDMLMELIREYETKLPFSLFSVQGMFLKLWTYLLREHYWENNKKDYDQFPEMLKVRDYIRGNLNQPITLDMLSAYCCISKYHLSRSFSKTFGVSPIHYHQQERIRQAKLLIQFTQKPFTEIAQALGFDSIATFSRAFKKMEGVAPSYYRSKHG